VLPEFTAAGECGIPISRRETDWERTPLVSCIFWAGGLAGYGNGESTRRVSKKGAESMGVRRFLIWKKKRQQEKNQKLISPGRDGKIPITIWALNWAT